VNTNQQVDHNYPKSRSIACRVRQKLSEQLQARSQQHLALHAHAERVGVFSSPASPRHVGVKAGSRSSSRALMDVTNKNRMRTGSLIQQALQRKPPVHSLPHRPQSAGTESQQRHAPVYHDQQPGSAGSLGGIGMGNAASPFDMHRSTPLSGVDLTPSASGISTVVHDQPAPTLSRQLSGRALMRSASGLHHTHRGSNALAHPTSLSQLIKHRKY
jgi:hypothetical protein